MPFSHKTTKQSLTTTKPPKFTGQQLQQLINDKTVYNFLVNNDYLNISSELELELELEQIYIQNDKIIREIQNNYNTSEINIIGKGPSATYIVNKFAIGINQGLIFTNGEILCMNDFQSLFGIEHLIPKIKYIFMPYHIHVYANSSHDFTYKNVLEYLYNYKFTGKFTGKVFVYFIQTTLIDRNILNPKYYMEVVCSTHSAINICHKFLNPTVLNTYGYKNGPGYHPDICTLMNNIYFSNIYKPLNRYKKYYDFIKKNFIKNKYESSTTQLSYNTIISKIGDIVMYIN